MTEVLQMLCKGSKGTYVVLTKNAYVVASYIKGKKIIIVENACSVQRIYVSYTQVGNPSVPLGG